MFKMITTVIAITITGLVNAQNDRVPELYPSHELIEKIKHFEGFSKCAHWDNKGVSIGYGTQKLENGKAVPLYTKKGKKFCITEERASELLMRLVIVKSSQIKKWALENEVTLNQNQLDALTSFVYNLGFGTFERSTVAASIIKGKFKTAANAITWYNQASGTVLKGLETRRAYESKLFVKKEVRK